MNKDAIYTDAPASLAESLTAGEIIPDFLPSPEQLVRRMSKTELTITLNSRSVEFYKQYAEAHHIKYQTMINEVLDIYAQRCQDSIEFR
jgi:hypothetical protein